MRRNLECLLPGHAVNFARYTYYTRVDGAPVLIQPLTQAGKGCERKCEYVCMRERSVQEMLRLGKAEKRKDVEEEKEHGLRCLALTLAHGSNWLFPFCFCCLRGRGGGE